MIIPLTLTGVIIFIQNVSWITGAVIAAHCVDTTLITIAVVGETLVYVCNMEMAHFIAKISLVRFGKPNGWCSIDRAEKPACLTRCPTKLYTPKHCCIEIGRIEPSSPVSKKFASRKVLLNRYKHPPCQSTAVLK